MSLPEEAGTSRAGDDLLALAGGKLLDVAVGIATAAGRLLLGARAGTTAAALEAGATRKSSATDLATAADRASEELVRAELRRRRPDDAILGEEGGATPGRSGLVWIVDPLDGTTNFVYGFPAWSVSIAVARRIEGPTALTLAGVVHDPLRGETFAAVRGGGATLNGTAIACRTTEVLGEALVGTGFGYSSARRATQAALLTTVLPAVRDIRRAGSAALDLCSVACGRLDAYFESGLEPWDRAAGVLIATEAGATAHELDAALRCTSTTRTGGSGSGGGIWDLSPDRDELDDPTLVLCAPGLSEDLLALLERAARTR